MNSATSHVTTLTLSRDRVKSNLAALRSHIGKGTGVIAVIKAFGYGTDATALAKIYAAEGVEYLAVAYVEEGVKLREAGVCGKIMVLNPDAATFNKLGEYNLEPSLISIEHLEKYAEWAKTTTHKPQPVHLNFNTGMNRLGLSSGDVSAASKILKSVDGMTVASVYTHLAATESSAHDAATRVQLDLYKQICSEFKSQLNGFENLVNFKTHALNSSGAIRFPAEGFDFVRVGLVLLGTDLSRTDLGLKPALFYKTIVTQVQTVPAGSGVGYGYQDPAPTERTIAWIPVGYADGYPRRLSNGKGRVGINGALAPIVGAVCMDLTAVDVSGVDGVKAGTEVELFGDTVTLDALSDAADALPYEVITQIHPRVIRLTE